MRSSAWDVRVHSTSPPRSPPLLTLGPGPLWKPSLHILGMLTPRVSAHFSSRLIVTRMSFLASHYEVLDQNITVKVMRACPGHAAPRTRSFQLRTHCGQEHLFLLFLCRITNLLTSISFLVSPQQVLPNPIHCISRMTGVISSSRTRPHARPPAHLSTLDSDLDLGPTRPAPQRPPAPARPERPARRKAASRLPHPPLPPLRGDVVYVAPMVASPPHAGDAGLSGQGGGGQVGALFYARRGNGGGGPPTPWLYDAGPVNAHADGSDGGRALGLPGGREIYGPYGPAASAVTLMRQAGNGEGPGVDGLPASVATVTGPATRTEKRSC
jgi:hypothetical protein